MPRKKKSFDTEKAACHSLAELISLGKKRGYKAPDAWARKVIQARQRRRFL